MPATGRADARTLSALDASAQAAGAPRGVLVAPAARPRTPADLDRTTVRAIQQALARAGFAAGAADGVWGERTRSAIGNLQRAYGMPASGELDAHTLVALGLLPGRAERPPARADGPALTAASLDPAAIRMIQQALRARGIDVAVDGQWGERTVEGLRAFQRSQAMDPLGEPDVHTLVALGLIPGESRPLAGYR